MKWIPTAPFASAFRVFTSSYGGGMLQGDRIDMHIECRDGSSLCLESQGNQHLYTRQDGKRGVFQNIQGEVGENSRVISLPQPTVMHEGSDFHQNQTWSLKASSQFILVDTFHIGRSENGERFSYRSYGSDIELRLDGEPIYLDRFQSQPDSMGTSSPTEFGPYAYSTNIYSFGEQARALHQEAVRSMASPVEKLRLSEWAPRSTSHAPPYFFSSSMDDQSGILTTRACGRTRLDLSPIEEHLREGMKAFFS